MSEQVNNVRVPLCGFNGMKVSSHKPWNEREVSFSTLHITRHMAHDLFLTLKTNNRMIVLLTVYVVLIGGTLMFGVVSPGMAFIVTLFLLAMIIGLMIRNAKKEIIIEGLQSWFKDAYGLLVPYEEAAIAYANFTNKKVEYELPNKGIVSRVQYGLIYTPPGLNIKEG